jgi:hypothetical protein
MTVARRLAPLAAAAALCTLSITGSASGAATLDQDGVYAGVAMDRGGNAHAVWRKAAFTSNASIGYCTIRRGNSACAPGSRETLVPPPDAQGSFTRAPYVFVAPNGDIVVVESRSGESVFNMGGRPFRLFTYRSSDGGANFGPPQEVGSADLYNREAAEYAPNDRILTVNDFPNREDVYFQSAPPSGPPVETAALLHHPVQRNGYTAVGYRGQRPVVVIQDGLNMSFRAFTGAGDPNDAANWTAEKRIVHRTQVATPPSLASGPRGLFLAYGDDHNHTAIRKFNGSRFGSAHVVRKPDGGDIFEDAGGRLYLSLRAGPSGSAALYTTSSNGTSWSRPRHMPGVAGGVRIAAAPGRGAISVWSVASTSGIRVKAARFGQ